MGLLNDPERASRARLEQAAEQARRQQGTGVDGGGSPAPRQPRRYKLYDRIKGRVSVTAMNVIICATVLLLIIALVIGIATGTPQ